METQILIRGTSAYPEVLEQLHRPPPELFTRGNHMAELLARPRVAIVGSRLISPYGRQVTAQLAQKLAEQGIVIVSGLALGVDAVAHESALAIGGLTIAVLPSPVERVAPATNYRLANRIVASGGALVSTYPAGSSNHKGNFVERNQIVAALSDVVVITEAAVKSGSLHTAKFAIDLGRDVLAVPGNITSQMSVGTNSLIKTGAGLISSVDDILRVLGLPPANLRQVPRGANQPEQCVLDLLVQGISDGNELLDQSHLSATAFSQTMTMLEITAKITPLGANRWGLP